MSYYLAPSLAQLRSQINAKWPNRDKGSDGWIGDPSHQARVSDHNPDYRSKGVVRALDIDKDGVNVDAIKNAALKDSRTGYVIWNRQIWTPSKGWQKYSGPNPHTAHIHISLKHTKSAEVGGVWALAGSSGDVKPAGSKPKPKPVESSRADLKTQERLKKMKLYSGLLDGKSESMQRNAVKAFQKAHGLHPDGDWGAKTEAKYQANVRLQNALNACKGTKIVADGYIGASTRARIKDVKLRNGWATKKNVTTTIDNQFINNLKRIGAYK